MWDRSAEGYGKQGVEAGALTVDVLIISIENDSVWKTWKKQVLHKKKSYFRNQSIN